MAQPQEIELNATIAEEISSIQLLAFRAAHKIILNPAVVKESDIVAHWTAAIGDDHSLAVIKNSGTIVAFCVLTQSRISPSKTVGEIRAMYIVPPFQGFGYGRDFMTWAIEKASQKKWRRLDALVIRGNSAIGFYRHLGFEMVGEPKHEFVGKKLLCAHMQLDVKRAEV